LLSEFVRIVSVKMSYRIEFFHISNDNSGNNLCILQLKTATDDLPIPLLFSPILAPGNITHVAARLVLSSSPMCPFPSHYNNHTTGYFPCLPPSPGVCGLSQHNGSLVSSLVSCILLCSHFLSQICC
jgi:hypothetical protein